MRAALFALVLLVLGSGAARADEPEARCRELLPVFAKAPEGITAERHDAGPGEPYGLRLGWHSTAQGDDAEGFAICWFLPRTETNGAWQLHEIQSSKFGWLRRYDIQQAYKMLRAQGYAPADATPPSPYLPALYILQQLLNGISLGCVYALMAVGYTLVFGVTRVFNLAFGPFYALGAYVVVVAWTPLRHLPAAWLLPSLGLMLLLAVITGGAYGYAIDRVVFSRLRRSRPQVGLIAGIGLAIAIEEALRIAQGARTRYVVVAQKAVWPIVTGEGFDVVLTKAHVMVAIATLIIGVTLWWLWQRTAFGRQQRACAQDLRMAELLGVDVERTMALTFVIGGTLIAAAGMFTAAHYAVVTFYMGTIAGLKALTAALLGGIGSAPGAALGGLILALTEVLWVAYFPAEWKDVAAFALLVGILWLRPQGILGTPRTASPEERF